MNRALLIVGACLLAAATPAYAQRAHTPRPRVVAPLTAIAEANADARRRPNRARFVDATQMYEYAPGALYEVYGAPGFLSTLLLEPGESIVTVAAGDTTRWMVEEAVSADDGAPRSVLLIKPTRTNIRTNVVLVTDRRTYLIEAIAAQGQTYSAQVAWTYPAANQNNDLFGAPRAGSLYFGYQIRTVRGWSPRWRPLRVYDDGAKTTIEFPGELATSEAPPLFLIEEGRAALVNYRVAGNRYVVDRLFDVAELRLGARRQTVVRITRERPEPLTRPRPRRRS